MIRARPAVILLVLILTVVGGFGPLQVAGQTSTYALLSGSDLTDDCLICDRVSLPIPLQGTFQLLLLDSNPLFTRYQLTNISFRTTGTNGRTYEVTGGSNYQVGGEVTLQQDLTLNVQINDGSTNSSCLFTNAQSQVKSPWPEIQTEADQSNGTLPRLYRLRLIASPVPQFSSVSAVASTATVRLEWESYGGAVQVERARSVDGPYSIIASNVTAQALEDIGVLTNVVQSYYRLRQ
jgi:hypothetical protein